MANNSLPPGATNGGQPTSAQLLQQLNNLSSAPPASKRNYIGGLPDDYTVSRPEGFQLGPGTGDMDRGWDNAQQAAPLYRSGDEFSPASLSPEDRARLQARLAQAGLLKKGTQFQLGVWDAPSQNAYKELLAYANSQAVDDQTALNEYLSGQAVSVNADGSLAASGSNAQPIKLSNPEDIKALVRNTAPKVLGMSTDEETVNRIVKSYQDLERQSQQEPTGPEFTDPLPDANQYVKDQIRAQHPAQAGATDLSHYAAEFMNLLGSSQAGIQWDTSNG